MGRPLNFHRTTAQVLLPPRASPQAVTAGRHDGAAPLALLTLLYVCMLPSRHARVLRACSDSVWSASPCTRAARADKDVLERRRQSAVVAPTPLALAVALVMYTDAAAQVRRCAEHHMRPHSALASHFTLCCVSWHAPCLSSVLACVHGLCVRHHPLNGSGCRLPHALAGSATAAARGGRPWAARWACRYVM